MSLILPTASVLIFRRSGGAGKSFSATSLLRPHLRAETTRDVNRLLPTAGLSEMEPGAIRAIGIPRDQVDAFRSALGLDIEGLVGAEDGREADEVWKSETDAFKGWAAPANRGGREWLCESRATYYSGLSPESVAEIAYDDDGAQIVRTHALSSLEKAIAQAPDVPYLRIRRGLEIHYTVMWHAASDRSLVVRKLIMGV